MTPAVHLREILVPTDLSGEADCAVEHARFLAGRFGARLTLYHATEVPDHRFAHWAFAHGHEVWVRAEQEARHALAARAESLGDGTQVVVERTGSVHRALVGHIRHSQPDLTVMATHGREGLAHVLLGSVTDRVLRHAPCPVLVA